MQKARRHPSRGLRPLVSVRFQVLFHSLIQGTFHLSLTVLVRYRSHRSIQPYRMVPADSRKVSRAPRYSGYYQDLYRLTCTGLSPSMIVLSKTFQFFVQSILQSYNPNIAVTTLVWATPRSLATTNGITFVFFSSRYLDVSVPWVCLLADTMSSTQWVAPFGYLRINLYVPIPATFRSLSRPSSPLRAQAFPIRSYLAYCTFCFFNELLSSL